MAQTPNANDSSDLVARAASRHLRLTRRTGNASALTLARRIESPLGVLVAKSAGWDTANQAANDAFDDWNQDDGALDRTVHSVDRKSADYDADHPGERTRNTLFAGQSASEVTGAKREDEPNEVDKIVARGARLADTHPAKPLLAELTARADASRASHRAWLEKLKLVGTADAELEQAKLDVIAQYRDNVHDLTRAVGEDVADACFPALRKRGRPAKAKDGADVVVVPAPSV